MTHSVLSFSAAAILRAINHFDQAMVLFSGPNSENEMSAIVGIQPSKARTCFTLNEIHAFLSQHPSATSNSTSVFRSGWMGYFSYEAGHVSLLNNTRGALPLAEFFEYPVTLELNLVSDAVTLHNPRDISEADIAVYLKSLAAHLLTAAKTIATKPTVRTWQAGWSETQYQAAFAKTHAYLRAGDCYQVNLAMPFYCADDLTQQNPMSLLYEFNPTFGAYFKSQYLTLFCVSPERFIRIEGSKIETKPIKGTIGRGKTTAEDSANKEWLANSQKNQAENLMIVDLLRNDLSKHAEPFSVKVDALFNIETHANVHHMVSTITATKRPDTSSAQVIFDALPGGSITGAPKKRAMEIINELETAPRGPYCGVLGYFDDNNLSDFNILIRTIVATKEGAICWAGGGVVMDSTCSDEWQELHTKVQRILQTPI